MPAIKPLKHVNLPEKTHTRLKVYTVKNKFKSIPKAIDNLLDNAGWET